MPTRRFVHALTNMARHFDLNADEMDRVEVASWMPLPDGDISDAWWFGAGYDAVVIDCLDEMFRPQAWLDAENILRHGRWLRECAQRSSTAPFVTASAESPDDVGAPSFDHSWRRHRVRRPLTDIVEASCEMFLDAQPDTVIRMAARGGQRLVQRSRLDDDSLIRPIIRS